MKRLHYILGIFLFAAFVSGCTEKTQKDDLDANKIIQNASDDKQNSGSHCDTVTDVENKIGSSIDDHSIENTDHCVLGRNDNRADRDAGDHNTGNTSQDGSDEGIFDRTGDTDGSDAGPQDANGGNGSGNDRGPSVGDDYYGGEHIKNDEGPPST